MSGPGPAAITLAAARLATALPAGSLGTTMLADLRDIQPPVIAALLLGACATKLARMGRAGAGGTGLGPAELIPRPLRRPLTLLTCGAEFCLALALLVTMFPVGTRPGLRLFAPSAATGARVATAAFFLVAAAALVELRGRRPDLGCGCFGELSRRPAALRPVIRAVVLTVAALISVQSPALYLPPRGRGAVAFLGLLCAELALIAALSPEVSEALVRLGYSDPCELRTIAADRTLAALHRSRAWRRHAQSVTTELPIDMWRELCWRYVVFPYRDRGGQAEVVFAVQMKRRRPAVRSAVVPLAAADPGPPGGRAPDPRREALRLSNAV
jgi:hypothetical protein